MQTHTEELPRMTDVNMPDWPEEMRDETLAKYLDVPSKQTLHRMIKKWPGFPPQSPTTKRRSRRKVDAWLLEQHGQIDRVASDRRHLDRELGLNEN